MFRMTKNPAEATAITHSGVFHGDEVVATAILSLIHDLVIARVNRVPEGISEDDVYVYDIGFGRYDHHQKGGNGTRPNGIPYSSAGLIWRDYGMSIISKDCADPRKVWSTIDCELIQGIDASDNGFIPKFDKETRAMTFSQAISSFNPNWDSEVDSDTCFMLAVEYARILLKNLLARAESTVKAKSIVEEAISASEGGIMVLDRFVPWQEALLHSECEKAANILFVVFPSNRGGFNFQAVPVESGSREVRKSVPDEWRGLSKELSDLTGVKTATFCHQAGFIGAAGTLEDAIALARLAI